MARPWRIRYAGAKYHVTVRGNGRQVVFHDEAYYRHFMEQLADALEKDEVVLLAYVLMPNHYHLFVETPLGNIQRFMQRLNTAYSMYHRYKHGEPGHCFQGRYGAKLVRGDDYIIKLTRYIHLNPVKVAAMSDQSPAKKLAVLNGHKWSSYLGYTNEGPIEEMVNYECLTLMPGKTVKGRRSAYQRYVERFLSKNDDAFMASRSENRYAIGDAEFINEVEDELKDVRINKGVYGDIKWPESRCLFFEEIAAAVADAFKVQPDQLMTMSYATRTAKKVALELACRYSNQSQRQVGEYFGYKGNGSVMKQRQRLTQMLQEDKGLQKTMEKLEKQLAKS